jgi:uridine phosphorylase
MIERLAALRVQGRYLTNFEMETAGYYALGELLGHEVLSLNAILANRPLKKFDASGEKTVERAVETALASFTK